MGLFVLLPLVLPLTAWPIARLAELHLHPRSATRLLAAIGVILAVCSTLCMMLLVIVGTAQVPGNPLPDSWSGPEVRAAVPFEEVVGRVAILVLGVVGVCCAETVLRHWRVRRHAGRAVADLPDARLAVLPDRHPYAYALPGRIGRVVVSEAMLASLSTRERSAVVAHEQAHLQLRHHRHLLAAQLAARANPFLHPLRRAVAYTTERWADEEAARCVGDRKAVARAIGKAALVSRGAPVSTLAGVAGVAGAGPVPRRVQALLGPEPAPARWPRTRTATGLAAWTAAAGVAVSTLSSLNAAITLILVLKAATPL